MKIEIHSSDSVDRESWDNYIYSNPSADHYHLSGWGRVIEMAYGYTSLYYRAYEKGMIAGVLPVVVMGGFWGRKRLVSMPFLDYGGICAERFEVEQALYEAVYNDLANKKGVLLDLRHRRDVSLPLSKYGNKVTMILELASDAAEMWKEFGGKVRNQIRKAEKEKLGTQWVGEEGLRDFYQVYSHNMRDLGSPPHSLRFFKYILTTFPDTRILLVRLEKEVIGGGLCLVFRDTMLVPWASSLRAHFRLCPNNLLYWEAIRTACEEGLRYFDFGRSPRDGGTYKFKKQWGALEEPLYWQSSVPGGDTMEESDNGMLGLAVRVWKSLPVNMTRVIGPALRRRISN